MNAGDIECLAAMLDKNAAFSRPANQVTGYSLEGEPSNEVVATGGAKDVALNPASIALPSTVVDQQLHLPMPTHSKEAREKRAAVAPVRPRGNEIWTQEELRAVHERVARGVQSTATTTTTVGASAPTQPTAWGPTAEKSEPEHTVLYQQNLTAEDVYLGVDMTRDESSSSSDGVVVKVDMPLEENRSDIVLEVEAFQLKVVSPHYYLCAPLPRQVKVGVANAQWDVNAKRLVVRLTADTNNKEVMLL